MAELLSDPRVTVFIGDGFKFLADNESTYDVIITDSSDPVGPAQSLFQKPYFQLLHDALTPGGHISTQAECLWLHLPLIAELKTMTASIFPVSEYAFTTIPTYPAGQIGFILCSREASRDLKNPLRQLKGTRYYNDAVHRASFVLPEFAREYFTSGKSLLPILKPESKKAAKKVLLLGSGFVARPCAEYIVRDLSNSLTIGWSSFVVLVHTDTYPWHSLSYPQECRGAGRRPFQCICNIPGCEQHRTTRSTSRCSRSCHFLNSIYLPRSRDQGCYQGKDPCCNNQLHLPYDARTRCRRQRSGDSRP